MSLNSVLNIFTMLSALFAEAAHAIVAFLNVLVKLHLLFLLCKTAQYLVSERYSGKNQKQGSSEGRKLKKVMNLYNICFLQFYIFPLFSDMRAL